MTAERLCLIGHMPWYYIAPLSIFLIIGAIYYQKKIKPPTSRSIVVPCIAAALITLFLVWGYATTENGMAGKAYSEIFDDFIPTPDLDNAYDQKQEAEKIASKLKREGSSLGSIPPESAYIQLQEKYPGLTMYQADIIIHVLREPKE